MSEARTLLARARDYTHHLPAPCVRCDIDAFLAAPAPPALDVERLARALPHVQTVRSLTIRLGTFNDAWWERFADEVARAYAGEGEA